MSVLPFGDFSLPSALVIRLLLWFSGVMPWFRQGVQYLHVLPPWIRGSQPF
jgi:hypothetical protein